MSFSTAYMTKRRSKMAAGGDIKGVHKDLGKLNGESMRGVSPAGRSIREQNAGTYKEFQGANPKLEHERKLQELKTMKGPHGEFAEGGSVDSWTKREDNEKGIHRPLVHGKPGESSMGAAVREGDSERAKRIVMDKRKESRSIRPELMAEGGEMEEPCMGMGCSGCSDPECMSQGEMPDEAHQSRSDELDMVSRILAKHAAAYSEGGRVANKDQGESASVPTRMAKDKPNEFDDLALNDDLESSYTGANSGDELGNERLDGDEADIIEKVMRSRRKKDRMAVPGEGTSFGK